MCGICGIIVSKETQTTYLEQVIGQMTHSLQHRGPDGGGIKIFAPPVTPIPLGLGHRRLAVIDLTEAGRQPMSNEDETIWIVFNGEIYNFQELRQELCQKGHLFRSLTDTEVIVHLYEEMGPKCVQLLNGMFAFALLDLRSQKLMLARDRIGIKPLYYFACPNKFVFGSEIKSILASGAYSLEVNWQAIYDYFTYLYIPYPETAFSGIFQLSPAHILLVDLCTLSYQIERYWQVEYQKEWCRKPLVEIEGHTRELLTDSVQRQIISDVPLGVFLSGGVDSPIIAGLMKQIGADVHTFTVVFEERSFQFYNERDTARVISQHIGTNHQEIPVTITDPWEMLDLIDYFDQPFGNPTFYLMYLVSLYSREYITVALCGAGGDELYAGYPRYRAVQLRRLLRWIPRPLVSLGMWCLDLPTDSYRTMFLRRVKGFLEGWDKDFIHQFAYWTYHFEASQKARLLGVSGKWDLQESERFLEDVLQESPFTDDNRILHLDVQTFLINNLLEYTDKMSMAVALEVRVPWLDHRFVEFSLNIPFKYKLCRGQSKALIRQAFKDFFPAEVVNQPKKGFNLPLPQWMKYHFDAYFDASVSKGHPLRQKLGEDIGITWREGILRWDYIQSLRDSFLRGKKDYSYELFAIIVFDLWWRKYIKGSYPLKVFLN